MSEMLHFKISTGLKSVIGRELINDKYIALFELVKNSYDAESRIVSISFDDIYGDNSRITITDNGNGMSKKDIIDKWLFVAYSEKKNASYRDGIKKHRSFAGAKGVGRFSCDRLGSAVDIFSKTKSSDLVNHISVNWDDFENEDSREFQNINIQYDNTCEIDLGEQGTAIVVSNLRERWDRQSLLQLKKSLAQLVNPEASAVNDPFSISIKVAEEEEKDQKVIELQSQEVDDEAKYAYEKDIVNGIVNNNVFKVLNQKTTRISVTISEDGKTITTDLNDRGVPLFSLVEKNPFRLKNVKCVIFSLNRSAKINFTKIMGVESVNYGSVFIYKNGFRVFPYGEPNMDFFNIDQRKAQGYNRYLGTREIIGRIDIFGENGGFVETSSRNNGFISSDSTSELENFFYEYVLKPLEKYVVNIIHWGDGNVSNDELVDTIEEFDSFDMFLKKLKPKYKKESVISVSKNEQIFEIISSRTEERSKSVKELKKMAEQIDAPEIISKVEELEKETEKLVKENKTNREALQKAEDEKDAVEQKLQLAEKQVGVLQSQIELSAEDAIDTMHIMKTYADTIDSEVEELLEAFRSGDSLQDCREVLFEIRQNCAKILNAYNLSINTEYRAENEQIKRDIFSFTKVYVSKQWSKRFNVSVEGTSIIADFNPVEFSIIIDNIVDNSKKHNAQNLTITFFQNEHGFVITWRDDGYGIDESVETNRVFEKGYTSTNGTGIGLSTVKDYVEEMGGKCYVNEQYKDGFEIRMEF